MILQQSNLRFSGKKVYCLTLLLVLQMTLANAAEDTEGSNIEGSNTENADQKKEASVTKVSTELLRDKAIAAQLSFTQENLELKWLKVGTTQFLSLFYPNTSRTSFGSLLILPSPSISPMTEGMLPTIAKYVSTRGWHALTFNTPELDFSQPSLALKSDADISKWQQQQQTTNMELVLDRLLVAEKELLARGGRYVLLAQGVSAEVVLELISSKVIKPQGLIVLNIGHPSSKRVKQVSAKMAKISIPILDLYNNSNAELAKYRKMQMLIKNYRQVYIPGSDNNFRGSETMLSRRINGWLVQQFSK